MQNLQRFNLFVDKWSICFLTWAKCQDGGHSQTQYLLVVQYFRVLDGGNNCSTYAITSPTCQRLPNNSGGINEWGEPTASYKWTGRVWENNLLKLNYPWFKGNLRNIPRTHKKKAQKIIARNQLDLETLGFWPITPQKFPRTLIHPIHPSIHPFFYLGVHPSIHPSGHIIHIRKLRGFIIICHMKSRPL